MPIYTHKHHIIPRHAGGSDDPSNIAELSVPDHAEAHRILYEQHGRWQDFYAWKGLTGQITMSYARRMAGAEANRGKALSDDHKRKISESSRGHTKSIETRARMSSTQLRSGNNFHKNHTHTKESNQKRRLSQLGIPQGSPSDETRRRMSASAKSRPKSQCPHCQRYFNSSMMTRWHGDKCKAISLS